MPHGPQKDSINKKKMKRRPANPDHVEMSENQQSNKTNKKRKNNDDRRYNPKHTSAKRNKRNDDAKDPSHIRTDNAMSFDTTDDESEREDERVKNIPIKTAVIVMPGSITYPNGKSFTPERISRHFDPSKIPSDRPIAKQNLRKITSPHGTITHGSPISVETPGGTTLILSNDLGLVRQFSNRNYKMRQPDFELTNSDFISTPAPEFFASDEFKNIKKILDGIKYKEQELHLTPELLKNCQREHEANHKQRPISQNAVMVEAKVNAKHGSAHNYAKSTNAYELFQTEWNGRMEWLHLIAYQFTGREGQDADNLVVGSYHTNTEMMSAEEQAKRLAKLYPEGIKISVWADIIEKTHIAKRIYYQITTPDFSLKFDFLGASPNKPHITLSSYIHNIVSACVKAAAEKKAEQSEQKSTLPATQQTSTSVTTESLFKSPTKRASKPSPKSPTQFKPSK